LYNIGIGKLKKPITLSNSTLKAMEIISNYKKEKSQISTIYKLILLARKYQSRESIKKTIENIIMWSIIICAIVFISYLFVESL